jgi:hypothetical protein
VHTEVPNAELPNPFRNDNGEIVRTPEDWPKRRDAIEDLVVGVEYGGLPPTPAATELEELHTAKVVRLNGARMRSCRIHTGPDPTFSFVMSMLIPPGDGPFPVVLSGDACWPYVTDEVTADILARGNILARFNRVELAPDIYNSDRVSGIYRVYPEGEYGALAAWAWGYHRCVDALSTSQVVDSSRIAVVGHSRGGKASLLAGATDERIALTSANDSGAGGAGCYRWQGPESETLADLIRAIPYWFGPQLQPFVGREAELPFDQHFLKSLVAPRPLLTTEALGDLWGNPSGTWQSHLATREVYRFLGAEDRLGIHFREGPHRHSPEDWTAFLDFVDLHFHGRAPVRRFDINPFPDLPPAFSWTAPSATA